MRGSLFMCKLRVSRKLKIQLNLLCFFNLNLIFLMQDVIRTGEVRPPRPSPSQD